MKKKIDSYIGFAKKSNNIITGLDTFNIMASKGKVKLLILAKDLGESTREKAVRKADNMKIPYREFETKEYLSKLIGKEDRGVLGITNENFAKVIVNEIDEKEVLQ